MRAECHDRLSIANGCSRDVVTCFLQSEKKGENFRKKGKAGILSQKMLFPPRVVVDFFFDEEERRYAITRRQRIEHKKGEKLARASQNSPYSNPLCPFFPSSFHFSFICHAIERYKNARFVSINRKKANDEEKSSHPSTHYHR